MLTASVNSSTKCNEEDGVYRYAPLNCAIADVEVQRICDALMSCVWLFLFYFFR